MAESLSVMTARISVRTSVLVLALSAFASSAGTENLPDPTRPPASLGVGLESGAPEADAGPRLQSILIAPGRRFAIVSGQTVHVGDKIGEAQVITISEGEVVLRNGKDLQTLKLFPEVEKRPVPGIAKSKSRPGSQHDKDK